MSLTTYFIIWFLICLVIVTIAQAKENGQITLDDIPTIFLLGLFGPGWGLIYIVGKVAKFFDKRRNVVLWRSQKKKTEAILYGDTNNHGE